MTLRVITTSPAPVQVGEEDPMGQFRAAMERLDAELASDLDTLGRAFVAAMLADGEDEAARLSELRDQRQDRMTRYASDQEELVMFWLVNYGV